MISHIGTSILIDFFHYHLETIWNGDLIFNANEFCLVEFCIT